MKSPAKQRRKPKPLARGVIGIGSVVRMNAGELRSWGAGSFFRLGGDPNFDVLDRFQEEGHTFLQIRNQATGEVSTGWLENRFELVPPSEVVWL